MDSQSFDPEAVRMLVAFVRAGSSLSAAAEAVGIPRSTFADWLRRGRASEEPPYGSFYQEVVQARGQARAAIETEVRQKDPKFWVRYGPDKSADKKRKARRLENSIPPWVIELLPVLDRWPEAKQAMAEHIEKCRD